ncbi:MAG: transposase [bacterium]|nr:transposase [bacterium]
MPRAYRYYSPGCIWHITHRCHQRAFLLKFNIERQRWVHWLGEARRRYGLCILNYCVTSNHVHLLVRDQGEGEIARSMQLIQGRVAQEYNQRKRRTGVFWHDRYHATAVDTGMHVLRCCSYIDLNMVRAGVVQEPGQWRWCGYEEIIAGRTRGRLIDRAALAETLLLDEAAGLARVYQERLAYLLDQQQTAREAQWTEAVAVGDPEFVEKVQHMLQSVRATWQLLASGEQDGTVCLKDAAPAYPDDFTVQNGVLTVNFNHFQDATC